MYKSNGKGNKFQRKRKYVTYMKTAQAAANAIGSWWRSRERPNVAAGANNKKRKYSSTFQERQVPGVLPMGISGPGSLSGYKWPKNRADPIHKDLQQNAYSIVGTLQVSANAAQQNYANILPICLPTDVFNISALAHTTENKIILTDFYGEAMITNPLNYPLRVTLYDVIARKDNGASNSGDPTNAMQHGYADLFTAGGAQAATNYKNVGTTPYSNGLFTEYYRIANTTNLLLEGGQVHTHKVTGGPQKKLDSEYANYDIKLMANFTRFVMIQIHGTPVQDSVTSTTVSLGAARVNVVWRLEYRWKDVESSAKRYDIGSTLTAVPNAGNVEEHYLQTVVASTS